MSAFIVHRNIIYLNQFHWVEIGGGHVIFDLIGIICLFKRKEGITQRALYKFIYNIYWYFSHAYCCKIKDVTKMFSSYIQES